MKLRFRDQDKALLLLVLMATTAVLVGGITLIVLYKAAFVSQEARLQEIAHSHANIVEYYAQRLFDQPNNTNTIDRLVPLLRDSDDSFNSFGRTGEYTLGRKTGQSIEFLLNTRAANSGSTTYIPLSSLLAEPMQRALRGQTGVMIGLDYRGKKVLAAYEPVDALHLGIVAKIDLSEFQAPFIRAGLIAMGVCGAMLAFAVWLFTRISNSMVESAEHSKSHLDVILDTVVDGIVTIDTNGTVTAFNSAAEKIFGYRATEVIGNHVNLLIPAQYHDKHNDHLKDYMENQSSSILGVSREVTGQRKDGSTFPMDLAVGNARLGKNTFFTAIVRDITERKQTEQDLQIYRDELEQLVKQRTNALQEANKKLKQLARRDSLTGIANRRVFDEIMVRELRRAARDKTPLTLCMCDIDYFKLYNDTYGHLAGDSSLTKVAKTIYQHFHRAGDLAARYGGEEFAIILPNTQSSDAQRMAEVLRQAIWDLNIEHKSSPITDRLTVSVGIVTLIPRNNLIAKTIIKAADDALYCAKDQGRNRIVVSGSSDTNDSSLMLGS